MLVERSRRFWSLVDQTRVLTYKILRREVILNGI
jgi:hypothetical protein